MKEKIYDNSNIAESYAGVTTPLTFSFARYVYQEVYQHFSKMMGADDKLIKENKRIFENMIEFIGYRIYYNLNSWYKMLSFFPGYKFSGEFMEKMMGVEKHNPFNEGVDYGFFRKYFLYLPKTILQSIKISLAFLFLGWRMERFNKYFEQVFSELNAIDLNRLSLNELKNLYKRADDKLLARWRVPIANDFAVMVSAGLADKFYKKWLVSNDAYFHMPITANKALVSLDPGNRVMRIVNCIKQDKKIKELFLGQQAEGEIIKLLHENFPTHKATHEIDNYLRRFGARMPNELKLESETLAENPVNFIVLIKKMVKNERPYSEQLRAIPKNTDYKNLSLAKRVFLRWLLRWAGNSIRRREEARFLRTLIFGYVRKVFLAIGVKMKREKIVKNVRDIFSLTIEEVFNIIDNKDNKRLDIDPLLIIKQRKRGFTKWQNVELPRRIETSRNISEIERSVLNHPTANKRRSLDGLTGRVASYPSTMSTFIGVALTLIDFDPTADFEGKILVTRQTDPGWTIIFPFLKGVVVERGGMLSHAAIIARELNIPCIVGVQQATDIISSGMKIKLDLQNGVIHEIC